MGSLEVKRKHKWKKDALQQFQIAHASIKAGKEHLRLTWVM